MERNFLISFMVFVLFVNFLSFFSLKMAAHLTASKIKFGKNVRLFSRLLLCLYNHSFILLSIQFLHVVFVLLFSFPKANICLICFKILLNFWKIYEKWFFQFLSELYFLWIFYEKIFCFWRILELHF